MAAVKAASVYLTRLSDLEFGGPILHRSRPKTICTRAFVPTRVSITVQTGTARCSRTLGATVGEIVTEAEYDNPYERQWTASRFRDNIQPPP